MLQTNIKLLGVIGNTSNKIAISIFIDRNVALAPSKARILVQVMIYRRLRIGGDDPVSKSNIIYMLFNHVAQ